MIPAAPRIANRIILRIKSSIVIPEIMIPVIPKPFFPSFTSDRIDNTMAGMVKINPQKPPQHQIKSPKIERISPMMPKTFDCFAGCGADV